MTRTEKRDFNEHKRSEFMRALVARCKNTEAELERERADHKRDVDFLTRVIIAALCNSRDRKIVLSRGTPDNAEFILEENISGEMIIILGKTT